MNAAIGRHSRRNISPAWRVTVLLLFIQLNGYRVVADATPRGASPHAASPFSMAPRSEHPKDEAAILAALADYFYPDPIPGYDEYVRSISAAHANKARSAPRDNIKAVQASPAAAPAPGRGFSVRSEQVDDRVLPTEASAPAPGRGFAARSTSGGKGVLPSGAPAMPQGSARATAATAAHSQNPKPSPRPAPHSQNPKPSPKPEPQNQKPNSEPQPASVPQDLLLQNQWFGAPSPEDTLAMEMTLAREIQRSVLDALAHRTNGKRPADGIPPAAAPNASEPDNADHTVAVAVSVSGVGSAISIATADGEVDPTLAAAPAPATGMGASAGHTLADLTSSQGAPTAAVSAEGASASGGARRPDDRQELPDFAGTPLPERNLSSAEMQAWLLALSDVAAQEKGVAPNPTLTAVGVSQELASVARSLWFPWADAPAHAPTPGAHPAGLPGFAALSPLEGAVPSDANQEPAEPSEDSVPDEDLVQPSQAPLPITTFPEGAPESSPRATNAPAPQTIGTPDEETPEPPVNHTAYAPAPESIDDLEPETLVPSEEPTEGLDPAPPAAGSDAESPAAAPATTSLAMPQELALGTSETDILKPVPGTAESPSSSAPLMANGAAVDITSNTADSGNAPSPLSTSPALLPDTPAEPQAPAPVAQASSAAPALEDSRDAEKDSAGFGQAITVLDRSSASGGEDPVEYPQEPLVMDSPQKPTQAPSTPRMPAKAPSANPSLADALPAHALAPLVTATPVTSSTQAPRVETQASSPSSTIPTNPSDAELNMPDVGSTLGSQAASAQHVKDAIPSAAGPVAANGERKLGGFTPTQALRLLGLSQLDADRVALAAANSILARRQASGVLTRDRASGPALTAKESASVRQAG